jgi:heavy metal efflux system protein
MKKIVAIILMFPVVIASAQIKKLTVAEAVALAVKQNKNIQAVDYEWQAAQHLQKSSFDLPKTDVTLTYGQYNSYAKKDNNITITQVIPFSTLGKQQSYNKAVTRAGELNKAATESDITFQVKKVYNRLLQLKAIRLLLLRQDTLFERFEKSAALRYKTGESTLLEENTARAQRNESVIRIRQNEIEIEKARLELQYLINTDYVPDVSDSVLTRLPMPDIDDTASYHQNPLLPVHQQHAEIADQQTRLNSGRFAPDLIVGFFSQTLIGSVHPETGVIAGNRQRFSGFQVGLALPLFYVPHHARVRSASFNARAAHSNFDYYVDNVRAEIGKASQQIEGDLKNLSYFSDTALPNAELILRQSETSFREGEIGYAEYLLGVRSALQIEENYLITIGGYNESVIYYEYLTGRK